MQGRYAVVSLYPHSPPCTQRRDSMLLSRFAHEQFGCCTALLTLRPPPACTAQGWDAVVLLRPVVRYVPARQPLLRPGPVQGAYCRGCSGLLARAEGSCSVSRSAPALSRTVITPGFTILSSRLVVLLVVPPRPLLAHVHFLVAVVNLTVKIRSYSPLLVF